MNQRSNDTIQVSSLIQGLPSAPPDAPKIDFDGEAYTRARIREGLAQKFERMFDPSMRETDWTRVRPENAAAVKQVREWPIGPKGLLLSGPTGRLKTRAMVSLIGRLMCDEWREVVAYKANDWFNKLQSHINFGRDEAAGWVDAVAHRPIVFIDDLGQQAVTKARSDWAESWWFDFCDRRLELGLPLFITTNLSAADMTQTENSIRGDPLVRRLIDLCEPIKFR